MVYSQTIAGIEGVGVLVMAKSLMWRVSACVEMVRGTEKLKTRDDDLQELDPTEKITQI